MRSDLVTDWDKQMESFDWSDSDSLASDDMAPRASGTVKTPLQEVQRGLSVLHRAGVVIEMRIPKAGTLRTVSGSSMIRRSLPKRS